MKVMVSNMNLWKQYAGGDHASRWNAFSSQDTLPDSAVQAHMGAWHLGGFDDKGTCKQFNTGAEPVTNAFGRTNFQSPTPALLKDNWKWPDGKLYKAADPYQKEDYVWKLPVHCTSFV